MGTEHIKQWQRVIGVKDDGIFADETLAASVDAIGSAPTEPMEPPEQDGRSPSLRALHWCLSEAERWGINRVTPERVAQYFRGCERSEKNIGNWLAGEVLKGKHYSFCAAAQGFAEHETRRSPDAEWPWRAGALEIFRDALAGRRRGQSWLPASLARLAVEQPHPGALAVYENTLDKTRGHVERVIFADANGYRSVGANENGGRWFADKTLIRYADASRADGSQRLSLLGFVVDEVAP